MEILTFKINDASFGIDISTIDSVSKYGNIERNIANDDKVIGTMVYRDGVIPVIDMCSCLFGSKIEEKEDNLLMVCTVGEAKFAFEISHVDNIMKIDSVIDNNGFIKDMAYVLSGFVRVGKSNLISIIDMRKVVETLG